MAKVEEGLRNILTDSLEGVVEKDRIIGIMGEVEVVSHIEDNQIHTVKKIGGRIYLTNSPLKDNRVRMEDHKVEIYEEGESGRVFRDASYEVMMQRYGEIGGW